MALVAVECGMEAPDVNTLFDAPSMPSLLRIEDGYMARDEIVVTIVHMLPDCGSKQLIAEFGVDPVLFHMNLCRSRYLPYVIVGVVGHSTDLAGGVVDCVWCV